MNYRWKIQPQPHAVFVNKLAKDINCEPTHAKLLHQRGFDNFDKAKIFFRPTIDQLHNPFLMKDMDKAVARIAQAIENNEKIIVYGDYDVDGTTAVALMYLFLKDLFIQKGINHKYNLAFYIPDRYKEGYGISTAGIDFAKANNYKLIICLDCGIKSIDKIDYANTRGVDFIICDHHTVGDQIPNAIAVLDPKRKDCDYPYKELSGNGVGFKLCQALTQHFELAPNYLHSLMDLCAISIAADIVPITGENRVLAYFGMKLINEQPRAGIKAILDLSNVRKELSITDCVFLIGPRINAAGRIDTGNTAVKLLIASTSKEAQQYCVRINKNNTERQGLDKNITLEALQMLEDDPEINSKKSTVLFSATWHKGVVGIVASRLTEKYYRPTIVLTESNGMATGSARSVKDFDVYEAIAECSDLLDQFGGHKYAAGLTMPTSNVPKFITKFETVVNRSIKDHMLTPEIEIDCNINFSDITPKFLRILKQFAPFGPGNMNPIFKTKNVIAEGNTKIFKEVHLGLDVVQSDYKTSPIAAIGFNLIGRLELIKSKKPFEISYAIEENQYNGQRILQLSIKDIRAQD
ncbi:MAG: single-stranded-DNA-specific exonuclease RecJ [Bacteroidia bacterium]|nr:single-stranded-DNA-specific exonuclease RecJ [Bacteroidia bacterium]